MEINEDYGVVLKQKRTKDKIKLANIIGLEKFALITLELKEEANLKPQDKILIKDKNIVKKVKGQISYDELSKDEKNELEKAVHSIIIRNENKYVKFFNKQSKESTKLHFLEGISRKSGSKILNEKENGDFESFEDINKRVSFIKDSENLIAKRVLYEIIELPNIKKGRPTYLFVNAKRTNKKEKQQLDDFEKDDSHFLEMIKKEGLLEKSGKRIK